MGSFMSNYTYDHVSNQPLDVDRHWNKVVIALTSIHYKWYELGTHLNIPNGTLQSISDKYNDNHFKKMSDLISTWIRRPTPDHHPSRRVICVALANMGEVALADTIAGVKDEDQSSIGSNDPHITASKLKKSFDELLEFMTKEIAHVDIDVLRLKITQYFKDEAEGKVDSIIEQYLAKIDEQYKTPIAILNYFIRSDFIGYINYSLIKVFQSVSKSQLLDLRIKKYEEQYQSFLNITFKDYIEVFQHHSDLRPDYPAGIPQFSFYLGSEWNGKTMITLKEILQHCLPAGSSNPGFIHQLMITRIEQNCIIIAFAVLPHIAREVLKYLTNDDVIESMKKEGISVNISEQLMKYEDLDTTESMQHSLENCPTPLGLEIGLDNPEGLATGILSVKPQDWDTLTDTPYGSSDRDSEANEDFQLIYLKADVTKEAIDTPEKVVDILGKRNKSLETQLVTHKRMKMEPDNTRATGILSIKPNRDTFTDIGYGGSSVYSDHRDSEANEDSHLVELKDDVTLKEAVETYERVVSILRNRIKSFETQLVTHKQMMMELDNTRETVKQLTLERDEAKDQLKKIDEQLLKDKIDVSTQTDHKLESAAQDSTNFRAESQSLEISQHLSIHDFNEVSLSCQSISPQWATLAKYLNVGVTIVEIIETRRGEQDTVWCLDELLKAWLRQTSVFQLKPSWRILCDAIANIDRPLAEKIWHCIRTTPVATAVQRNDLTLAAKELSSLFNELLDFTHIEIQNVDIQELRLLISKFFKQEEELNDEIDRHLMRLENSPTPVAILNYFVHHDFIGYINYSLIKVFQELAKSPLLDKRIEQYEKDYHSFLELALSQPHITFQQCPDLCPRYPAGIPNFTIHLKSEYDGRSIYTLKDFLKRCFTNNDFLDQLLITKISRN